MSNTETIDWVNTFFKYHTTTGSRGMILADGTALSVQASRHHYCSPRYDNQDYYSQVEIGFPSCKIEEIMEYAEDPDRPLDTVYGYVPVDVLNKVIESRGGIKNIYGMQPVSSMVN